MRQSRKTDRSTSCPACGNNNANELVYSDTQEFRGLTLDLEGLRISKCANCGEKWFTPAQTEGNSLRLKEAYAAKRDAVRKELGLLNGTEIAAIRTAFELTQKEASVLFGGGPKSFNKYESGEVLQSQAMDKLLRMTMHFGQRALQVLRSPQNMRAIIFTAPENTYDFRVWSQPHFVVPIPENQVANDPEIVRSAETESNNLGIVNAWEQPWAQNAAIQPVTH